MVLQANVLLLARSSWTNKLITAKDHASVQINIGHLDANGVYTGAFTTLALAGSVRAMVCPVPKTTIGAAPLQDTSYRQT